MAARYVEDKSQWYRSQLISYSADLTNERVRHEYERGYKVLLDF